eukprot:UN27032
MVFCTTVSFLFRWGTKYTKLLGSLCTFCLFFNASHWFRGFTNLSVLVQIILGIALDLGPFLFVFFWAIFMFSTIFRWLTDNHEDFDNLISSLITTFHMSITAEK